MNNCPQSVVSCQISGVSFSFSTAEKIRRLSVKRVFNALLFDDLGHPTKNGLYDPALGPLDKDSLCATCSLSYHSCPGHFGHIELVLPVYNPVLFGKLYEFLRITCPYCQHLRYKDTELTIFLAKMKLIDAGCVSVASGLDDWTEDWRQRHKEDRQADELVFLKALNKRVKQAISQETAANDSTVLPDRSTHGYRLRHDIIRSFLRDAVGSKVCPHCQGHAPRLVKVGHTKIFEKALPPQSVRIMQVKGLKRYQFDIPSDETHQPPSHTTKKQTTKKQNASSLQSDSVKSSLPSDKRHSNKEAPTMDEIKEQQENANIDNDEDDKEEEEREDTAPPKLNETYLTVTQLREHVQRVFARHVEVLSYVFGHIEKEAAFDAQEKKDRLAAALDASMFFLDVLPVAPTRFRPANKMDDQVFEHPQNVSLTEILRLNEAIYTLLFPDKEAVPKKQQQQQSKGASLANATAVAVTLSTPSSSSSWIAQWMELQRVVNALFDSTKAGDVRQQAATAAGIRQLLEKKEGLFRKHMMGKRVNFAARSVISPDPYLETNEIGLPAIFATRLTYPEPVTPYNVRELRDAVIRGPDQHPGATHVQLEDGTLISLAHFSRESRVSLSQTLLTPSLGGTSSAGSGLSSQLSSSSSSMMHVSSDTLLQSVLDRVHTSKCVIRHIRSGDVVLVNRQPTLHKPSIMAHRVRVLPGEKTLRMHYANCDTYNADFDGDEMNIHFPQNEVARAEAYLICETDQQYLVPTDGTPLRGLIQDHIGTAVLLTCKDTLLTRADYQQLVFYALPDRLRRRRDDDAVQTTATAASQQQQIWTAQPALLKPAVRYTGKQVITTILVNLTRDTLPLQLRSRTKIDERAWGADHADETRVLIEHNELLQGVLDKSQLGASPYGLIHACHEVYGAAMAGRVLTALSRLLTAFLQCTAYTCSMDDLLLTARADAQRRSLLSSGMATAGQQVAEGFLAEAHASTNPGSLWTVVRDDRQLAALDGRMRSRMNQLTTQVIDACLPGGQVKAFPWNQMSLMILSGAKGSRVNFSQISCLLGQQELEGRRVPVMVSGKTLPSFAPLDTSARAGGYIGHRFLSGIAPQEYFFHCMAGREGLIDTAVKTARSGYLQRCLVKHLEGLRVHYDGTVRDFDHSVVQFRYGEDALDIGKRAYLSDFEFCALNYKALARRYNPGEHFVILDEERVQRAHERARRQPQRHPPVLSLFHPGTHFGAISERYDSQLETYLQRAPAEGTVRREAQFRSLMWLKYMRSVVDAGEAVGVLAAQSIGEPSTQMTLNTFHFAGHGAQNVTLGIPRLREIIMTASTAIKTPAMRLPLRATVERASATALVAQLNRVTLSQLVCDIAVSESIRRDLQDGGRRQRVYVIRLQLDEAAQRAAGLTTTTTSLVADALERPRDGFVHRLHHLIQSSLRQKRQSSSSKRSGEENGQPSVIRVQRSQREVGDTGMGKKTQTGESNDAGEEEEEEMEENVRQRRGGRRSMNSGPLLSDSESDAERGNGADNDDADNDNGGKGQKRAEKLHQNREEEDDDSDQEKQEDEESWSSSEEEPDVNTKATTIATKETLSSENTLKMTKQSEKLQERYAWVTGYELDDSGEENSYRWCELRLAFPMRMPKLLMISLVEKAVAHVVVRETHGISQAELIEDDQVSQGDKENNNNSSAVVVTSGANFYAMWKLADPYFKVSGMYTNDVAHMLETYGVEAARAVITREIASVFKAYGISVDARHLLLISDYMTFEGGYRPFNRRGMETGTSPFLKMSFETTMEFLKEACLTGDYDTLQSPSARLVVGEVVPGGTGCFEIRQPLLVSSTS